MADLNLKCWHCGETAIIVNGNKGALRPTLVAGTGVNAQKTDSEYSRWARKHRQCREQAWARVFAQIMAGTKR